MAASRASSIVFLRRDWSRLVLRFRHGAETNSGRQAEVGIQGPPEIQIKRKISATGDELAEYAVRVDQERG